MPNLRDLRKRRKGAANTKKITRTMELVSSAKLKKAQDAAAASRPYAEGLRQLMSELAAASGGVSHPLMAKRTALMASWGDFCRLPTVVPFDRRRAG